MKTILTILFIAVVGFLAYKPKNQSPAISPQSYQESIKNASSPDSPYSAKNPSEYQALVKVINGNGSSIDPAKNVPESNYRSDNNPVTYDENPGNYPLYKPKTYINTYSAEVQSPTHYNAVPEGACAVCRDGSYSFSQNRRGTCSHHGGVARWLK